VARLWSDHQHGRHDHRHRLWSLVMLELWFRQFVDDRPHPRERAASARRA